MTRDEIERYVEAAAALLDLTITPAQQPGVVDNFERLAILADFVDAFELGPEHDAGPRWEP